MVNADVVNGAHTEGNGLCMYTYRIQLRHVSSRRVRGGCVFSDEPQARGRGMGVGNVSFSGNESN